MYCIILYWHPFSSFWVSDQFHNAKVSWMQNISQFDCSAQQVLKMCYNFNDLFLFITADSVQGILTPPPPPPLPPGSTVTPTTAGPPPAPGPLLLLPHHLCPPHLPQQVLPLPPAHRLHTQARLHRQHHLHPQPHLCPRVCSPPRPPQRRTKACLGSQLPLLEPS